MAKKSNPKRNPRRPVDEDPLDTEYLDEEVAEYIREEAREERRLQEELDDKTFDSAKMNAHDYKKLVEWTYEKLGRPSDFAYSGDRDMFETWALGPVIVTRDSSTLEKANAIALENHLQSLAKKDESLVDEWELTRASHWAVGWVDHISFHAIDNGGYPTKISAILKEWFDKLADYGVADEDLLSSMEMDEQGEDWENFYRDDFTTALEKELGIYEVVELGDFVDLDQIYELFRAGDELSGGEGTEADASYVASAAMRAIQKAPSWASSDLKEAIKSVKKAVAAAKKVAKKAAKANPQDDSTRAKRMMNPRNY